MKKNISINISGIIFHIEEDGYEVLKNYLDSVNLYFARFEDNKEILADIESRIAEIFLTRISASKQVISMEDVQNLISTMGTIADFAAVEDTEEAFQDFEKSHTENPHTGHTHTENTYAENPKIESSTREQVKGRRFYRDTSRKILGGVASGLAGHFNVDPIWVRLLFVLVFLSSVSTGIEIFTGITTITYIVLWIIIPGAPVVVENQNIKKLFRNPDNKVLGGVASGMAAYFGTDALVFRLLFVLTIFMGGAGFIIYVVFWIITPEARTISDKIQMQGEPVTLYTIEDNVKKNFNVTPETETAIVQVILFPFRLISTIFTGLAKILQPLFQFVVDAVRTLFGLGFMLAGLAILFSLLVASGITFGMYGGESYAFVSDIPFFTYAHEFSPYVLLLFFTIIIVPSLVLILLGVSIIRNKRTVSSTFAWSLFAIWIICVAAASATAPGVISKFIKNGNYEYRFERD